MEKCNHDCFNCIYDDCINDSVYSEKSLYRNRSEQNKENQRKIQKRRRAEAKEKGLCIVCMSKKATCGTKCHECYICQKRYDKAKYDGRRQYWKENGLCYQCGAEPLPGKKVCKKHYDILLKNIAVCNASEKTKNAQVNFGRKHWKLREAENGQNKRICRMDGRKRIVRKHD